MSNANSNISIVRNTVYRNPLDLIATFDRTSRLGALRSLAGAIQFTLINTADWIVRKQDAAVPSDPTLDARNTQDEFTRYSDTDADGNSQERTIASEMGFEVAQDPRDKLKQYAGLYYALVDEIKSLYPNEYERPRSINEVLSKFVPRGANLSEQQLELMKALEMEPGEFDKARLEGQQRAAGNMAERKPQIADLIDEVATATELDQFCELPVHVQLRLACGAYKGIYFRRKQLVQYIAISGKMDKMDEVALLQADLALMAEWCKQFEEKHSDLFEAMIEAGIDVYTIDDAKFDVKKPRAK